MNNKWILKSLFNNLKRKKDQLFNQLIEKGSVDIRIRNFTFHLGQ